MLNKRKIVVSDYDGTFYLDENGVLNNVEKVNEFRKEKNLFVMATGNNWKQFQTVISKYNIKYDYLISDQGACIFDNKNNLLRVNYLDYDISKKITSRIKENNKEYKLFNPYEETKTIEEKNITKIAVNFTNLQEALDFNNKINKEFGKDIHAYTMIFEKINIVEIISSKADKNEAIKCIINEEGIQRHNVYTIGNGYNDISMIQNFNGYCMKDSVDELLEKCPNRVTSVADLIDKIK